MTKEHLTIEKMEQKYPDEWLLIVDYELSENTELLSGRILVHSPSRADVYDISSRYKGSAAIHYTGEMLDPLRYQLEITDFKMAMWRVLSG